MAVHISPHLVFDGQCREAFTRYQEILGGKIVTMLSYGESPMAPQMDKKMHARIVHATLALDDGELTGVDLAPDAYRKPAGFFVTLSFDSQAEAEKVFHALALGGEVRMPFQTTFWSPGFGVVVDAFGVPWEINSGKPAQS